MSKIKIYVSCHKESELPKNSLYEPIHVGAALANKNLGILRDDTGNNISKKNPEYCELTAQYWAWKNDTDADYIGLCHYRRFLCFADVSKLNAVRNERGHIMAAAIDDFNVKRFGLENEAEMRAVIEANDVVVGELQNVRHLPTPRGFQKTAYMHWAAHDRDLIFKENLDEMLSILDEDYPSFAKMTRKYLATNTFLGFNCFIMKREFFNEMCEIEFSTLKKLEGRVNLSTYSQTQSRIFGFMGEIIFSAYVYQLEKRKKAKVRHVPILYFNYTDKIITIEPRKEPDSIHVIFMLQDSEDIIFSVTLQSFLDNIDTRHFYDIVVESAQISQTVKAEFSRMTEKFPNVAIRYADHTLFKNQISERFSVGGDLTPFVPYLFPKFKKALVFSNVLFSSSIVPLWNEDFAGKAIVSPADVLVQGKVKDVFPKNAEIPLKKMMENPLEFHNMNSILWDFENFRKKYPIEKIAAVCRNKIKAVPFGSELNSLCEGDIKPCSIEFGLWLDSNEKIKYFLQRIPLASFSALKQAQKNPTVICYENDDPWNFPKTEFAVRFWETAQKTVFIEQLLLRKTKVSKKRKNFLIVTMDYCSRYGFIATIKKIVEKIVL